MSAAGSTTADCGSVTGDMSSVGKTAKIEAAATAEASTEAMSKADRAKAVMDDPKVVHSNYVPAQLHRHLEFFQFNKDGHLIMGCSDLTGRNWSGSLWYYRDPVEPPNVEKALTGIELDQSVVDGRLVANNRMLVGLDNGGVEQVTLTFSDESDVQAPSFFFLERQYSVQEHDDLISGLDLTKDPLEGGGADGGQLVTVSYDRSIVALDINTMRLESRISDAHPNLISAVAANRFHRGEAAKTIATAAQDGTVQLWDLRTSGKQNRLYSNASDWPTALEWNPDFEHHLYVGTQTGKVHLMDSRNETAPLLTQQVFNLGCQVHKLQFNAETGIDGGRFLAVCGDSSEVVVFNQGSNTHSVPSLARLYTDSRHTDFVRGMAWSGNKLHTCGWDHKFFHHEIPVPQPSSQN